MGGKRREVGGKEPETGNSVCKAGIGYPLSIPTSLESVKVVQHLKIS